MRIEPRIAFGEPQEAFLAVLDEIVPCPENCWQRDRDPCPFRHRRALGRVVDLWLLLDVLDSERDVMGDAIRFDNGFAGSVLAVAVVQNIGHRQDGLERIALCTACR